MKRKERGKEVLQGGGVFQRVKGLWLFLQGGMGWRWVVVWFWVGLWYKLGIGVFDNGKVLKGVDNKMLFREWGVWGE